MVQNPLVYRVLYYLGGASQVVLVVKEPAYQCRRHKRCRFDPWVSKILWRRAWQPTAIFLPGESFGQREPGGLQSIWSHSWTQLKYFIMHTCTNTWYLSILPIPLLSIPHSPPPFSKLWPYWISLNVTYPSSSWTFLCTLFSPYPLGFILVINSCGKTL